MLFLFQSNALFMSKQRVILLACTLLVSVGLSAQKKRFDQGFGLAGDQTRVHATGQYENESGTITISDYNLRLRRYGVIYVARMDLIGGKAFSISLGSSVTAGWSSTRNYRSVDITGGTSAVVQRHGGSHLAFDIPVFVDVNIGLHSAIDESRRKFGLYAGAGYGYSYTKIHTSIGMIAYDGFDPIFRIGFRMGKRWENRWGMAATVRGSPESGAIRTYGLQLLKEL
jgi:hypothetical protein